MRQEMDTTYTQEKLGKVYADILKEIQPEEQFNTLYKSLEIIERRLERIAGLHSLDTWYPYLRRALLGCSGEMDSGGLLLATHVLQKFSPVEAGSNDSRVAHDTLRFGSAFRHDHVVSVDDDYDLEAECRDFWAFIWLYRRHQRLLRYIGYGGKFQILGSGEPEVTLQEEIRASLEQFAKRRARDEVFSEHGVPLRAVADGCEYVIAFDPMLEEQPDDSVRYQMTLRAWTGASVREFFGGYDRSLKIAYGLTPDDLTHVLVSLSQPVLAAMIALGDHLKPIGDRIELVEPVPSDRAYAADVVKQLLLKGYARLPTQSIAEQIEITPTYWCHDQTRRAYVAKQFTKVFSELKRRRGAVDIERGIGASLLVPANEDYTYIDYCHMRSFLAAALLTAQKYLASQHGHNFNLLLVERIKEIDPSYVVDFQVKYFVKGPRQKGQKYEGDWDILLLVDGHAIAVECKAFIESDAAARGHPAKMRSDWDKIWHKDKGAVAGCKEDLRVLKELLMIHPGLTALREARDFSGVVCTLKSEFVKWPELDHETPCGLRTVVSMSELLDYCRRKKSEQIAAATSQ